MSVTGGGTHMGPLIIRAISTLTSATNSCRSGYGSSTSEQLAGGGSLDDESKWALWVPRLPPSTPHPFLLLIRVPAGIDVNHAPHHAQTQAQVPRHGARLTVLVRVLLQRRRVHRGVCRVGRVGSGPMLFWATTHHPAQRPSRRAEKPRPQQDRSCPRLYPTLGGWNEAGCGKTQAGPGSWAPSSGSLGPQGRDGDPPADTGVSGPCS